jgi:phosphonate transport system ATP-binding protein
MISALPSCGPVTFMSVRDLHVLRGVSFDLARGEGVVLLGANGCGKSTLMRSLNGLEAVESGRIELDGQVLTGLRSAGCCGGAAADGLRVPAVQPRAAAVGAPERPVRRDGAAALRMGLGVTNAFARAEDRERAMALPRPGGLADRATHRPAELSGGQQQRVAIARMLMQAPQVVIADEPIASLDPKAGREVLELLWRIVRGRGAEHALHAAPARSRAGIADRGSSA